MSRVGRYSRLQITGGAASSPTGLSPAAVCRSSTVRLTLTHPSEARSIASIWSVQPRDGSARSLSTPPRFGLCPVRSPLLRASSLFLGVLRCFSSPGSLPLRVDGPSRPPGCPIRRSRDHQAASASPEHFVAWPRPSSASSAKASTVCPSFRSIHPRDVPASADHPARLVPRRDNEASRLAPFPSAGKVQATCTVRMRRTCHTNGLVPISPADGPAGANQSSFSCQGTTVSGAAGARTPNLRRARAALSQLSYDPRPQINRAGGRAWTRTRDLGLIRAAL
jgi:hypothetical protein